MPLIAVAIPVFAVGGVCPIGRGHAEIGIAWIAAVVRGRPDGFAQGVGNAKMAVSHLSGGFNHAADVLSRPRSIGKNAHLVEVGRLTRVHVVGYAVGAVGSQCAGGYIYFSALVCNELGIAL